MSHQKRKSCCQWESSVLAQTIEVFSQCQRTARSHYVCLSKEVQECRSAPQWRREKWEWSAARGDLDKLIEKEEVNYHTDGNLSQLACFFYCIDVLKAFVCDCVYEHHRHVKLTSATSSSAPISLTTQSTNWAIISFLTARGLACTRNRAHIEHVISTMPVARQCLDGIVACAVCTAGTLTAVRGVCWAVVVRCTEACSGIGTCKSPCRAAHTNLLILRRALSHFSKQWKLEVKKKEQQQVLIQKIVSNKKQEKQKTHTIELLVHGKHIPLKKSRYWPPVQFSYTKMREFPATRYVTPPPILITPTTLMGVIPGKASTSSTEPLLNCAYKKIILKSQS